MNFFRNIYKLYDKLINLVVIVLLSVLCIAFDKLTNVNFSVLNFRKAQYFFDAYTTKLNVYYQGHVQYVLLADHMQFLSESNHLYCWNCILHEFDNKTKKLSTKITSKDADYNLDQQLLLVKHDVQFHTFADDPKNNIDAFTDHATIHTDTNMIYSDADILIKQGISQLTGTGFSIDYNKNLMVINSHVKLIYREAKK